MHQAAEYQNRRADDKDFETKRRQELLKQEPTDITPPNSGKHIWTGKDLNQFEKEWSMKPVTINGMFNHRQEI